MSLLVVVIGVAGALTLRSSTRRHRDAVDTQQARWIAYSAVERGIGRINEHRYDWRYYGSGLWINAQSLGSGSFDLQVYDPVDGDLNDDAEDPVVLVGTGRAGGARQRVQVTLVPQVNPLGCLEHALHVHRMVQFPSYVTYRANGTLGCNEYFLNNGASIFAPVMSAQLVWGYAYYGPTYSWQPAKEMPNSSVFDSYLEEGTRIPYSSLPSHDGTARLTDQLLSPSRNPYSGGLNAKGIYIIDCAYRPILIHNCRIVGTLVLLNTTSSARIYGENNFSPAVVNYPTILVKGDLSFEGSTHSVSEWDANCNMNPPQTPYNGASDGDKYDHYPSTMQGLMYVSGRLYLTSGYSRFEGVVLAGYTTIYSYLTVDHTYNSIYAKDPPPGFRTPPRMVPASTSWRRNVD